MKSDKIRIGLWGVGRHAERRLLPALRGCKHAVLTSIHTRENKIGDHVAIYWELDQKYYSAVVLAANQVKYLADSVIETVDFTIEKYQMLQAPSHM